jgi:hypothetical protein
MNRFQEVITSSPVYRTETLYKTSTIPLFLGAKKFFTTLTQSIGVTTVTDYETVTVSAGLQGDCTHFYMTHARDVQQGYRTQGHGLLAKYWLTRLSEFSPIGKVFNSGRFLKITVS